MSASEFLLRRKVRRYPWDEQPPEGVPDLMRVPRLRGEGNGMEGATLQRPVQAVIETAPDESGAFAPLVRRFSEGVEPAEMPTEALAPLRRSINFTPAEPEPMDSGPLPTIPPEALALQRRFTPPKFAETGNPRADLVKYQGELERWKDPADRDGRLKSALKTGGRLALRVLAGGGNPAQALGALAAGSIWGGVSPNANERLWRDEEQARTGQRIAGLDAQAVGALKRRELAADIGLKEANAEKARREPVVKPDFERVDTPEGYVYVDKNNPSGEPVRTGLKAPAKAGARPQTVRLRNADGSESVYERGSDNVWKDTGLRSAGQARRKVTLGGETFELPEPEAARVLAQIEAANITADAQGGANVVAAENENADRGHKGQLAAWDSAEALTKEYNTTRGEWARTVARGKAIERIPETERSADAKAEYAEAVERSNQLADALRALEGRVPAEYAERTTDGYFTMKPKPAPPPVKAKPAPGRRSGGVVPSPPRRGADPLGLFN